MSELPKRFSRIERRAVFLLLIPIALCVGAFAFGFCDLRAIYAHPHASRYHLGDDYLVMIFAVGLGVCLTIGFAYRLRDLYFVAPQVEAEQRLYRLHPGDVLILALIVSCFAACAWGIFGNVADEYIRSWLTAGGFLCGSYLSALFCICHQDEEP